jgi:D-alanyl-D-alanine carboxypeptidase
MIAAATVIALCAVRWSPDSLLAAYPDTLAAIHDNRVFFRDGRALDLGPIDCRKPDDEVLRDASILDLFRYPYPRAPVSAPPANDPGRFRNKAFFDAVYGDCRKGAVAPRLVSLVWLPKGWGRQIMFTSVNRAADALRAVSAEIDALPDQERRAAYPIAGTYSCRAVADAGQPSMHAYGAAIDLNLGYANYWMWEKDRAARYVNRMPLSIVQIFERHGFIWGGKWHHFDTMHFEYRPELLPLAVSPVSR